MPQPLARLPSLTWEEIEAIFDELAATNEQKDQAIQLLSMTRLAAGSLSPLDLMREIFCIALVLPCGNDRPPKRPGQERFDLPLKRMMSIIVIAATATAILSALLGGGVQLQLAVSAVDRLLSGR